MKTIRTALAAALLVAVLPARERDLVKAFEVALNKSREFKYELERMKVTWQTTPVLHILRLYPSRAI